MPSADTQIPAYVRFAIAGVAGAGGALASHPFDLIKYRMQLSGKGSKTKDYTTSLHAIHHVVKKEGPLGLFNGLSASIFRQATLNMLRMGMYSVIVDNLTAQDGTPPPVFHQFLAGIVSGALGAYIGNPADVALVRMSADGALPPDQRKNYKNVFEAMTRIYREEGLLGLWIGWRPAVIRSMVLNVTQVFLYKNTKVVLLDTGHFEDGTAVHVICTIWTALVSSVATAPMDITKTRLTMMNATDENPEYTGMIDVGMKIIKTEGPHALWKGLTMTFWRILPNNFVIFLFLEHLTKTYKALVLGDKSGSGF